METTDRYKALRELNDSQLKAVDALLAGQTHAEAAEFAGVHRVTVSRWATKHPAFRVELNRRRQELLDQRVDRIRRLDALALDVVSDQLEDRDPATAVQWLKLRRLSATDVTTLGPTTYDEIIDREASARVTALEEQVFLDITTIPRERAAIREDVQDEYLSDLAD